MTRAHLYRPVTDSSGNVVPNTVITIYEAGTTQILGQTPWNDPVSTATQHTNPWTTSDGFIDFYLDVPQTVRIGLQVQGGPLTYIENIAVTPAPENQVYAEAGFKITNTPTVGQYLQSGTPGIAAWVNASDIVNGKPSALQQLKDYDWSGGVLDNAIVVDANSATVVPTFVDVTADSKPSGWVFTKALQLPTTGPITLKAAVQSFPETGQVIYLYKVITTHAGVGAAILHVSVDNDLLYTETPTAPDQCNVWQVGYLDKIPTGSHRITLQQRPGTDTASYVEIGPVWIQFGNNIPAHTHPGSADSSTALGPGALADYVGSTSVGSGAKALAASATAFGFGAQAQANGVALGANAITGTNSVAVGMNSGNSSLHDSWVAVGFGATVNADKGVALGAAAASQGSGSVAMGPNAATGNVANAVAIGSAAVASGISSVALGAGATVGVGHDYSLAIGPGVTTTAAHQAMIGDSATTLVVPGSLRQVGGDALLGGSGNKIGFFGSAGVTRPVVVGSRGGNAVLTQLLTLLNSMGLIQDASTS